MNPFWIQKDNIYAVPVLHYTMEFASHVRKCVQALNPDCIAVELPETMQSVLLQAAGRLPDISIISSQDRHGASLFILAEPCEPCLEGLRSALENDIPGFCIDLDVDEYPLIKESLPDPYAITHIGLKKYYEAYLDNVDSQSATVLDEKRELHMAKRLKELSLSYERILFISGFFHIDSILKKIENKRFSIQVPIVREQIVLQTLTEEACRNVMAEYGWITLAYESYRSLNIEEPLDRQKLIWDLYKQSSVRYCEQTKNPFPGYHMRNLMKFVRNYAWIQGGLMPSLFEVLSAAKGCVDHTYAYETWFLATHYPLRKNIDNLPELNLSVEEIWGHSKILKFHVKQKSRKSLNFQRRKKDSPHIKFRPPSPFSICSYPPEDIIVERFGDFLKKKGTLLVSDAGAKTIPFAASLEDGIDLRETVRHYYERKLYVKIKGRPPNAVQSIVVIFDEDQPEEKISLEKFPWKTTWIGEHNQESDMAFYATSLHQNIVGPGISRCEYGGFMMTSPPRRLFDIWNDPDYFECLTKAEVLLMAAIDYSISEVIVYVAEKPPRSKMKAFSNRYGKKIVFLPLGQISNVIRNKIRTFHVLDGHDKREIAGDYIF